MRSRTARKLVNGVGTLTRVPHVEEDPDRRMSDVGDQIGGRGQAGHEAEVVAGRRVHGLECHRQAWLARRRRRGAARSHSAGAARLSHARGRCRSRPRPFPGAAPPAPGAWRAGRPCARRGPLVPDRACSRTPSSRSAPGWSLATPPRRARRRPRGDRGRRAWTPTPQRRRARRRCKSPHRSRRVSAGSRHLAHRQPVYAVHDTSLIPPRPALSGAVGV